jgi:hypothetical protein
MFQAFIIWKTIGGEVVNSGGEVNSSGIDSQPSNPESSRDSVQRREIIQLGLESLLTRLPSALGVHHVPILLLGGIYLFRRKTQSDWFVLLWIGLMSSVLILTLPGHRYFLSTFPAMAIVISAFISAILRSLAEPSSFPCFSGSRRCIYMWTGPVKVLFLSQQPRDTLRCHLFLRNTRPGIKSL